MGPRVIGGFCQTSAEFDPDWLHLVGPHHTLGGLRTEQGMHGMQDLIQPLVHKAAVHDLAVIVRRTALCIGDKAELHELRDGRIGVFAPKQGRFFGLFQRKGFLMLGTLGPKAAALIAPCIEARESLRIRVVGLTPEHLSPDGQGEIHVSIWGDPRHLQTHAPRQDAASASDQTGAA